MAKRLRIPIFHMEAGNRSFDANVPEEVNRRIVDHIADFNLVYTEHARRNLLAEGLEARRIYLTGSPLAEVLQAQRSRIDASTATADMGLQPGGFFLVSAHREENVDYPQRLDSFMRTLRKVHEEYQQPVVVSLHPRLRDRLTAVPSEQGVQFHAPFSFSDYCRLQVDATCVLSDSGTIAEEAAMLGFPAVTIRDSIERPEALDAGVITMCGLESAEVLVALANVVGRAPSSVPAEYAITDTSERVLRLIAGLTGRAAFWSGLHDIGGAT